MSHRSYRAVARAFRRTFAVVVTASVASVAAAATPAFAATAPTTFVTMIGGGDYIGQSINQLFHPGNGTVTVNGSASLLTVDVSGGTYNKAFTLNLKAPAGQTLQPGVYDNAMRYPFQTGTSPGLSVFGDGRGCNTVSGRFVVHDVALAENNVVNRFSATYEHHCGNDVKSLIGQISINQPREEAVLVAGDAIAYPDAYPGVAGRTVPVWYVNRGQSAVTVSGAAVGGTNATDFAVTNNGCASVAAGATCAVSVRFTPGAAGARGGTLTISDSTTAGSHVVTLTGYGIAGHTSFAMRSEAGDYIGQGQSYDYTPANATITGSGTTGGFTLGVDAGSSWWTAQLEVASGDVMAPGTYTGATRASFTSGVGMDVSGTGRGCNTITGSFTVIEVAYKDGTGPVERFSATFEQHCEGGTPALRGWIAWRATDANTPTSTPPPPPDGDTISPVTDLVAYPDLGSVVLAWENPADAAGVVVRGAQGLVAPAAATSGAAIFDGATESVYVGRLTPGASYSFSVFAKNAGGALSAKRSITVRGSGITLSATSVINYGGTGSVTVKLVDAPAGTALVDREVDLYGRYPGTTEYAFLTTLYTNSSGVATVGFAPKRTMELQATFPGDETHLGATAGPRTFAVRQVVTATLSRTSVARGGTVTISGAVSPNKAGKWVYLQRYVNGTWKNLTYKALTSSSTYTFAIKPGTAGTWKLRVHRGADTLHSAGSSPTRTLSVT